MALSKDSNKEYTFAVPRRQNYALPFTMVNIMMKNVSGFLTNSCDPSEFTSNF